MEHIKKKLAAASKIATNSSIQVVFEVVWKFAVIVGLSKEEIDSLDEEGLRDLLGAQVDELVSMTKDTGQAIEIGKILDIRDADTSDSIAVPTEAPVECASTRLHNAVVRAQEAFWQSIVSSYPEISTGDFPPDASHHFDVACMNAASTWVDGNSPDQH